jgi:sulfatase maturation enzyme AslB (radical SAM superfamily)
VNLIVFVTSKCNLLCRHCFYWEELNLKKNELSLEEFERISRSIPNLLSVSLTGGEPFLRQDLPEIAELFSKNSRARNIQIPSNGFLVDRTVERAERLLTKVPNSRVCTGVSLDGPKEIHDDIRQNSKSFDRAIETFRELKKLTPRFPNLSVGIALTVSKANQDRLDEFLSFVEGDLHPDAITVTLARGNPMDPALKEVDLEIYRRVARRVVDYRRRNRLTDGWVDRLVIAKEEETYQLIGEAASATHRISPCFGGELIGVLSETGEVYPCEILDQSMGNVRDFDCDLAALWRAGAATAARTFQKELGCQCTYECAMSVNTLFSPRRALRIAANTLLK